MAYKIAIDASKGGTDSGVVANNLTEKDLNLLISRYISSRLTDLGIENFLIRDSDISISLDDRINEVNEKYGNGNNVIVLSNRINQGGLNGAEVMYALRNNSKLASTIASNLENVGQPVLKYYQLRDSNNTALDSDYLIRNTNDNQTIAVYYGYADNESDARYLLNNYEKLAEAVVKAIANYTNTNYLPSNLDGYYIVKKGDSLWKIASENNTTVNELKSLNNLSSNVLNIGQLLKLPTADTQDEENIYTVQKGDTLYSIANKYNTTVDNLKNLNNLSSNAISIGQKLLIPSNEVISNELNYVVKKGDSLWSIANKYNTTVDKIKSINNLSSNLLNIGQVLVIPSSASFSSYTVQKGDTLYSIAKKYNTTVDNLKKLNNLSSNTLSIGQKLLIPV